MPYDPNTARQLTQLIGAHASNPAFEYIEAVVEQLKGAADVIRDASDSKTKSEGDANRYAADLSTAQRTIREMREGNAGTTEMLKTLESIARNPKGAKQIAADTLAKINGVAPAPAKS